MKILQSLVFICLVTSFGEALIFHQHRNQCCAKLLYQRMKAVSAENIKTGRHTYISWSKSAARDQFRDDRDHFEEEFDFNENEKSGRDSLPGSADDSIDETGGEWNRKASDNDPSVPDWAAKLYNAVFFFGLDEISPGRGVRKKAHPPPPRSTFFTPAEMIAKSLPANRIEGEPRRKSSKFDSRGTKETFQSDEIKDNSLRSRCKELEEKLADLAEELEILDVSIATFEDMNDMKKLEILNRRRDELLDEIETNQIDYVNARSTL